MATETKTLSDLASLTGGSTDAAVASAPVYTQKLDKLGRAYATG